MIYHKYSVVTIKHIYLSNIFHDLDGYTFKWSNLKCTRVIKVDVDNNS